MTDGFNPFTKLGMRGTKEFVVGTASASIPLLLLMVGVMFPMITDNVDAINENDNEIVHITTTLSNLDKTIDNLDDTISKLDDKLDKMTLIMCDLSNGIHC